MQQSLLKINIVQEFPYTGGTADLRVTGVGDDGHTYAIKRLKDGNLLPISEWVGYHLCRAVGVQTPDFSVVWRAGGDPAFGSRWESKVQQVAQGVPNPAQLVNLFAPHQGKIEPMYAVDAFLPNQDRHAGNILFREVVFGLIPLAFDFSKAWLVSGRPFGDMTVLTPNSRTVTWWNYLKQVHGYRASTTTLDAICALPPDWLEQVIAAAPTQWHTFPVQPTVDAWVNDRPSRKAQAGAVL